MFSVDDVMRDALLIEDDLRLAELTASFLRRNSFNVFIALSGAEAIKLAKDLKPAVIVLDLLLPDIHGLDVCRALRKFYLGPILIMTAVDGEVDQVVAFEIGADDFITKPVQPRVLLARLQHLIRKSKLYESSQFREHLTPSSAWHGRVLRVRDYSLVIDGLKREIIVDGNSLRPTSSEFDLLWMLANGRGKIFSRDDLFLKLKNVPYDGADRSIDIKIAKIRKLLMDDKRSSQIIKTVHGRGYLFTAEVSICDSVA